MSEIKIENLSGINLETKKETKIEYLALNENSLKTIDELNSLFPNWKREHVLKKIQDTINKKDYRFVAKSKGTIIAHVKVNLKKSIHEHIADISSLIVLDEFRRKGIGLNLMKYALSKLPVQIKLVTLAVDNKNKKAIKLYKKMGFVKYGLLKKGSKINKKFVDNYLMYKEIKK